MIRIEILTPTWSRIIDDAEAVFLPGTECPFEVLPEHAPIISTLSEGDVRWRVAGTEESLHVLTGVVRLRNDRIQICVEV